MLTNLLDWLAWKLFKRVRVNEKLFDEIERESEEFDKFVNTSIPAPGKK